MKKVQDTTKWGTIELDIHTGILLNKTFGIQPINLVSGIGADKILAKPPVSINSHTTFA